MNKMKLIEVMSQHKIDRYRVAELVGVRKSTVDGWLMSETSTGFRNMPDNLLELLQLKLAADTGK